MYRTAPRFYILAFVFWAVSCTSDTEIIRLLKSSNHNDVILGAFEAGETGDRKFIPLLINNADDPRTSNMLEFKGFSVYQEKMLALQKIFKKSPPVRITYMPDSVVIHFYIELAKTVK
jgi:hypothetical protein